MNGSAKKRRVDVIELSSDNSDSTSAPPRAPTASTSDATSHERAGPSSARRRPPPPGPNACALVSPASSTRAGRPAARPSGGGRVRGDHSCTEFALTGQELQEHAGALDVRLLCARAARPCWLSTDCNPSQRARVVPPVAGTSYDNREGFVVAALAWALANDFEAYVVFEQARDNGALAITVVCTEHCGWTCIGVGRASNTTRVESVLPLDASHSPACGRPSQGRDKGKGRAMDVDAPSVVKEEDVDMLDEEIDDDREDEGVRSMLGVRALSVLPVTAFLPGPHVRVHRPPNRSPELGIARPPLAPPPAVATPKLPMLAPRLAKPFSGPPPSRNSNGIEAGLGSYTFLPLCEPALSPVPAALAQSNVPTWNAIPGNAPRASCVSLSRLRTNPGS